MPTLFISYKRGTTVVASLMEKLKAAHYRLWFDRDEIHLGDTDWQARIDEGLMLCDGVILNITPEACKSEPVRYEVKKARELGKPIFPIIVERITDYDAAIRDLGLPDKQHLEDFTKIEDWDKNIERLLRDLESHGLRVSRHDRRQQRERNNPTYTLHQTYLKRLAERIGTLSLAQIHPDSPHGVDLEQVYVDSPTGLSMSVEVKDWQVKNWWMSDGKLENAPFYFDESLPKPQDFGYETAPFETLIGEVDGWIQTYRIQNPDYKPDDRYGRWKNGIKPDVLNLHLNHLAAARDRLVILGAPGSGKSTFVKFLALCLAGAGIDDWRRSAGLSVLENWSHGALTPVYIELRRFVSSKHFPADEKQPATADHLWAYIRHEVLGDDLAMYADDLHYDLEHGHALLILDGLDEVPYSERKLKQRQEQLIALARSLNIRYTSSRIIVASRPYAYEGWTLPGFQAVKITEFEDSHRLELASKLYWAAGMDDATARTKAQALNRQLSQIDPELKDRPLFVTLMATIYLRGQREGLPTRRGALYRESILLLLDRWTGGKADAPSLIDILGDKTLDDLYTRLAALAYDVHTHYGEQAGTPEIDVGLLYKHLKRLGGGIAAELIPYLSENAGVLVSPGQDTEKDVFQFAHRTFQEYLAAVHLVGLCAKADSFALLREHIQSKPEVWRVPCVLAGDVLADTDRRGDLWDLLDDLLDDEIPPDLPATDSRWWAVWLASTLLLEQALVGDEKLRRSERAVCDQLRSWILKLIETPQALLPPERAACGRALSVLGDTRKGIGLGADGLPEFDWVDIPAGEFIYGDDDKTKYPDYAKPADRQTLKLSAFKISKYPVTYKQFQTFIEAPDGFSDARWWEGLAYDEYRRKNQSEPGDQFFKFWNHPREGVSWYDAIAFCRWLSFKFTGKVYGLDEADQWPVRLPTEYEWEKAARGTDGRIYPYVGNFDAAKGNTSETGINQTSAVGLFPEGASPYGVLDMSGNVWEWCLTDYRNPAPDAKGEDLRANARRVLRGGSWYDPQDDARAAFRDYNNPYSRSNSNGFRVVSVRPPSP